ncbi:MAG TPA: carboxymuconolactone decarboxylase family protein [Burkholderiales bacterium]|nr:carboxymuconolactone decarboxylase family protein [Burkholderiales bacterium]
MTEANASWKTARTTGQWVKIMGTYAPALKKEFLGLVAASGRRGKCSEKLKHLIWVAGDSVVTHLYAPGAALHAEEALDNGATIGEVMDTLRIASLPLANGLKVGHSVLASVLRESGSQAGAETAAAFSPEFMRAYHTFATSGSPGGLDERSRCLITLSVVSCPAIADREAIERSVREALKLGIDPEQILEVMELATLIGTHAFASGLDRMAEALARHSAHETAGQNAGGKTDGGSGSRQG